VTLTPSDGTPSTSRAVTFGEFDSEAQVIFQAASGGADFTVSVDWDQDADSPAACHGHKAWTDPLVSHRAKVGDPNAPRVAGRYVVHYRPLNYSGKPTTEKWRVTPLCDYFGCSGRIHSGGKTAKLRLISAARFTATGSLGNTHQTCSIVTTVTNNFTGQQSRNTRTVPNAWVGTYTFSLKAVRTRHGRAITITGTWLDTERPTPSARRKGCTRTFHYRESVRMQAA
jgi:hypothetical protein